jgi:hypothetical protein
MIAPSQPAVAAMSIGGSPPAATVLFRALGPPGIGKTLSTRTYCRAEERETWFEHRYLKTRACRRSSTRATCHHAQVVEAAREGLVIG